jgi:hypothetical protein
MRRNKYKMFYIFKTGKPGKKSFSITGFLHPIPEKLYLKKNKSRVFYPYFIQILIPGFYFWLYSLLFVLLYFQGIFSKNFVLFSVFPIS